MVKYHPIKNTYNLFKTLQPIPYGSQTVLINEDLVAFVIGGYDYLEQSVIYNQVYAFDFPDTEEDEGNENIDYVYQLDER